jgi:hypothetical protein
VTDSVHSSNAYARFYICCTVLPSLCSSCNPGFFRLHDDQDARPKRRVNRGQDLDCARAPRRFQGAGHAWRVKDTSVSEIKTNLRACVQSSKTATERRCVLLACHGKSAVRQGHSARHQLLAVLAASSCVPALHNHIQAACPSAVCFAKGTGAWLRRGMARLSSAPACQRWRSGALRSRRLVHELRHLAKLSARPQPAHRELLSACGARCFLLHDLFDAARKIGQRLQWYKLKGVRVAWVQVCG